MKTLIIIITAVAYSHVCSGQVPEGINYQAVVRNSSGQIVANTSIKVRLTIHDASISGATVFQETKTLSTNPLGLITTIIGSSGGLSLVDWSSNSKYLQVEIDLSGGSNFIDMGTTQLVSVPYALYAKDAASVKAAKTLLYLSH